MTSDGRRDRVSYRAVQAGEPTIQVAAQFGVSRQTAQSCLCRYREHGLAALTDIPGARIGIWVRRSRDGGGALRTGQYSATLGSRRIAHELARKGTSSAPSRITVHPGECRHGGVGQVRNPELMRVERCAGLSLPAGLVPTG